MGKTQFQNKIRAARAKQKRHIPITPPHPPPPTFPWVPHALQTPPPATICDPDLMRIHAELAHGRPPTTNTTTEWEHGLNRHLGHFPR